MVWQDLKNFGQETTIHGFSHISGEREHVTRKLAWSLILLFSFAYAGSMLKSAIESKYQCRRLRSSFPCYLALVFLMKGVS